jgi:hypothetical protein
MIGVNERDCDWPIADAYPFVVAAARKNSGRGQSSGHFHGNFGDGCKKPAAAKATPGGTEDEP